MIKIRDCEILDLLPYTFKTPRRQALSKAFLKVRAKCYDTMSSVLFWGDIENANPALLDAMAAELDCAFYSSDMPVEQKRSIIASTFEYNSRIGTVSSITALLAAAFGNGKVEEWYDYGGDPYYFRLTVSSAPNLSVSKTGYKLLESRLDKVKPKRAKLEGITFKRLIQNNIYVGIGVVKTYKKFTIPAGQLPDTERGFN